MTLESRLRKYLPEEALPLLMPLLRKYPLKLSITKARSTKFGDYRFPGADGRHRISINHNLNAFAFLITLLHEIAHLEAFVLYGRKIKPHGSEWANTFTSICKPFLEAQIFPHSIQQSLLKSLAKGHASSCTDLNLYRSLRAYDEGQKLCVEQLPEGVLFTLSDKFTFKKGPKSRKRYRCLRLDNKREYMVHPLAEVSWTNQTVHEQ